MFCPACQNPVTAWQSPCPTCARPVPIGDRWVLQRILGEGASGHTWLALDIRDQSSVAIKELAVHRARSLKAIELFEREAKVLSALDHPGIPKFIDHLVVEGPGSVQLYLVQDYIEGSTLTLGQGDERETVSILAELCEILVYLHGRRPPLIHRDIKPANVMRRPDGRLVLIDFGAVRQVVRESHAGGSTVAGTFGYMAPEQLRGQATPASDLYAVGALGVALLAGRDAAEVVDPIRPQRWQSEVAMSAPLRDFLAKLLQPDPEQRLQSAAAAATQARRLLAAPDLGTLVPAASGARVSLPGPKRAPPLPAPVRTADDAVTTRRIRRELRRLRWQDRWRFLDTITLLWSPSLALPLLIGGSLVLPDLLKGWLGQRPPFVSSVYLVLGVIVLWYAVAFFCRTHARWRHPWGSGALHGAFLQGWQSDDRIEARWRAYVASRERAPYFDDHHLQDATAKLGESLLLVPLLEARAYRLHLEKRHADAAHLLERGLGIVEAELGAGSVIALAQAQRYAVLSWQATGHREQAVAPAPPLVATYLATLTVAGLHPHHRLWRRPRWHGGDLPPHRPRPLARQRPRKPAPAALHVGRRPLAYGRRPLRQAPLARSGAPPRLDPPLPPLRPRVAP